jgi:hypothetical protein
MATPQVPFCVICNQPIEKNGLKYVNEKGKPVHEPCYVAKVVTKKPVSAQFRQSKLDCFA